jgi:4'-phosphopantetheinyl transferase
VTTDWRPAPERPILDFGAVHVWIADLDRDARWKLDALSRTERKRALAVIDRRKALRWARSRALLRDLAARYTGARASDLRFAEADGRRPALADPTGQGLFFSVSHSREVAMLAFAADVEVGIDVEVSRALRHEVAVTRSIAGDAAAASLRLLHGPQREREFLRVWTRHEAAIKWGAGTATAPGSGRSALGAPWLAEIDIGHRGVAALAAGRAPGHVAHWCLD